jgi:hypothetical protein
MLAPIVAKNLFCFESFKELIEHLKRHKKN